MASSQNIASIEPWMFRPSVTDSWLTEFITRDAETLTKALQKSISSTPEDTISPFSNFVRTDDSVLAAAAPAPNTPTPTVSSLSGSDQESAPKRHRVAAGKISKRKSRTSKRSQTTFITADPANFRQMVQQVTGVRFGGSHMPMAPAVLKPEPQRAMGIAGGRFPAAGAGCLPTLDTSAFLLDHQQQRQEVVGPISAGPEISGPGPLPFGQSVGALDAAAAASFASAGLDFDPFSSFPTLESSWKVM
ncbi:hypothetical protein SESBI_26495 [Sesbania bispinosa]|nr:hypothetical protein SESBI_26495 [Sesbania bispinosa]